MGNKSPKISVIIRTYNSASFIETAINSALRQTLSKDFYEIVVVDDGSTDKTLKILQNNYKGKIKLIKQKHSNHIKALNNGIEKSSGDYIILLDADDIFEPEILEKMFNIIKEQKDTSFAYCDYYEKYLEKNGIKRISLRKNIFNSVAGGILFDKKIIKKAGGYDESLIFPEYDLLIKIQPKYKGAYIPLPLFTYVRHKKSVTAVKKTVNLGMEQLFKKYGKIKGIRKY